MRENYKKLLASLILGFCTANSLNLAMASDINLNIGNAAIQDLGGATVNTNTATQAQIGVTGAGNVINWGKMNVDAGKTLDFNFSNANQFVLNKVTGGNASTFAGTLSASGTGGHVIISNPSGVVFTKDSSINMGSSALTVTTLDAKINQDKLELTKNPNADPCGVKFDNVKRITIGKDLTIISPGIEFSGADILVAGKVKLISADGLNFVASEIEKDANGKDKIIDTTTAARDVKYYNNVTQAYEAGRGSAITVSSPKLKATAAAMTSDGRLFLYGGGDFNIDKLSVGSVEAISKNGNININSLNAGTAGSIVKAEKGSITASGSLSNTDLIAENGNITFDNTNKKLVYLSNISAKTNNITAVGDGQITLSTQKTLDAKNDISLRGGLLFSDANLTAGNNIRLDALPSNLSIYDNSCSVKNTQLNAGNDIYASSIGFTKSELNAGRDITVDRNSTFNYQIQEKVGCKLTAGRNFNMSDSLMNNLAAKVNGDITIKGSVMNSGNTIEMNGGNLKIAGSDGTSYYQKIQYNTPWYGDREHFNYGGTSGIYSQNESGASYIVYGDLNIKGSKNVDISNTYATSKINLTDTSGKIDITYSNFNDGLTINGEEPKFNTSKVYPDNSQLDRLNVNLKESYIGNYNKPGVAPVVDPSGPTVSGNDGDGAGKSKKYLYDRLYKVDKDIDTIFRKQFKPRSFAATDDVVRAAKNNTVNNTHKSEIGTIHIEKEFKVH